MDLEKCGRTGVWGELLPRVREAQGGQRSTGGHQTQAVLLAQEILREDAAGRGLLGPVACRAGLALVWVHSGRRWPGVCDPISFSDLAPALPSAARGSPRFPSLSVPSRGPEGCFQGVPVSAAQPSPWEEHGRSLLWRQYSCLAAREPPS